jgi:hypothetical protein
MANIKVKDLVNHNIDSVDSSLNSANLFTKLNDDESEKIMGGMLFTSINDITFGISRDKMSPGNHNAEATKNLL